MRFKDLSSLALRGITGNAMRSWMVGLCALIVAGLVLATVLVVNGAQDSLRLAGDRLGADIIVVPQGSETRVQGALLMGTPVKAWMPASNVEKISAVQGVEVASPQLYLESLPNASCCSVSDMFMVAFDPATDFTIEPWLKKTAGGGLSLGQAVGGRYVHLPGGEDNIKLYGYILTLRGNLEPTGTNLDQSMFVTFETARDMARLSGVQAEKPLDLPADSVSSVMVKLKPGADPDAVALKILHAVPGVTPITSPDMFGTYRTQISGLSHALLIVLGLICVLALAIMALIFSMAVHERRRQIGVLRALGATSGAVLLSFLSEALLLAFAGGLAGVVLASLGVYLFRTLLVDSLGFPFLFPSFASLASLVGAGLGITLLFVSVAAIVPALRIARQEPAVSMRE